MSERSDLLDSIAIMFPANGRRSGWTMRSIGYLMPPLATDVSLDDHAWNTVDDWYAKLGKAPPDIAKRVTVGSQFIHHAIVSSGIERFIHFFVALDALFGERGAVEATILDGVCALPGVKADAAERIGQLYNLRNEILHGGSGTLEGWSGYRGYIRRFETRPTEDAAAFALQGLQEAFLRSGKQSRRVRSGRGLWACMRECMGRGRVSHSK